MLTLPRFPDSVATYSPLRVGIQDASGNLVTSFGSGTQYTDGASTPTHPIGMLPVFNNAGTIAQVSNSVGLPVNIIGGAGSGGTSAVDEASFTAGTSGFTPSGGVFNDTVASLTSGQMGTSRLTSKRASHINLRDNSGNELIGQKAMAASIPVVMASNQASFPVAATPTANAAATALSIFGNTALVATAVAVKASAGRIYKMHIQNPNTADAYLQFYDVAQGSVVVGTTAPTWTWWIPGNGGYDDTLVIPIPAGTAITVAATTTIGGSTAPSTGLLTNIGYI